MRFEVLGEVRALRDGEPVDLGPAKQRAVLAVLLLHAGRAVPTHQIVDAVWGYEPPENGANVVQKHIAGLRRALDPDRAPRTPGELLPLTPAGYVLRLDGHTVDADEFTAAVAGAATAEAVRAALALWRGEALAGLSGPFFDATRARLAEGHATAWERWAELELGRGRDAALVPELARLVEQFPLREGLRAHLMVALSRSGRQAEALAVFQSARSYLVDQFGTEPGELLQEAHRRILRGESAPAYVSPVSPPPYAPVSPPGYPAPAYPPPGAAPAYSPPGAAPAYPPPGAAPAYLPPVAPAAPARLRIPYGEIIFAVTVPLLTLTVCAWVYFVYAAARHHNRKLFLAAGLYGAMFAAWVTFMAVDPAPIESGETSNAEVIGIIILAATGFFSTIHGAVVAMHQAGVAALTAALSAGRGGR